MEVLGALALGVAGWLAYKYCNGFQRPSQGHAGRAFACDPDAERRRAAQVAAIRRRLQLRELNAKYRTLQLVLFRMTQAPDFRRVASWVNQLHEIPLPYRQRQFRRFRGHMLQHYARCVTAGADLKVLHRSLQQLLQSLGIATFEADYIRADAERMIAARTTPPQASFTALLQQHLREHAQRTEALRSQIGLDADMREQLLEAENTRFREALETVSGHEADTNHESQL